MNHRACARLKGPLRVLKFIRYRLIYVTLCLRNPAFVLWFWRSIFPRRLGLMRYGEIFKKRFEISGLFVQL